MGVSTKAWGPHAWGFLPGICRAVDLHIEGNGGDEVLRMAFVKILLQLKHIVPCIYCRRSITGFFKVPQTNPRLVYKTGGAPTFAAWIYNIHECVNKKLFWQQAKQDVTNIWSWLGYQPSLESVTYRMPDEPIWWFHFFTFMYYVMCDYPKAEDDDMYTRGRSIRHILRQIAQALYIMNYPAGVLMIDVLKSTHLESTFDKNLKSRMAYVQHVQRSMHLKGGVLVPDAAEIQGVCEHAIVGCDPNDTTRVGC